MSKQEKISSFPQEFQQLATSALGKLVLFGRISDLQKDFDLLPKRYQEVINYRARKELHRRHNSLPIPTQEKKLLCDIATKAIPGSIVTIIVDGNETTATIKALRILLHVEYNGEDHMISLSRVNKLLI